jgi:hypothetical protein
MFSTECGISGSSQPSRGPPSAGGDCFWRGESQRVAGVLANPRRPVHHHHAWPAPGELWFPFASGNGHLEHTSDPVLEYHAVGPAAATTASRESGHRQTASFFPQPPIRAHLQPACQSWSARRNVVHPRRMLRGMLCHSRRSQRTHGPADRHGPSLPTCIKRRSSSSRRAPMGGVPGIRLRLGRPHPGRPGRG